MKTNPFRLIQFRIAGRIMKTVRTNAINWHLTEAAKRADYKITDIVQSIRDQKCEAETVEDYSLDQTDGHFDLDEKHLVLY